MAGDKLPHRTDGRTPDTVHHEEQTYTPFSIYIGLGVSALLALTRKFWGVQYIHTLTYTLLLGGPAPQTSRGKL